MADCQASWNLTFASIDMSVFSFSDNFCIAAGIEGGVLTIAPFPFFPAAFFVTFCLAASVTNSCLYCVVCVAFFVCGTNVESICFAGLGGPKASLHFLTRFLSVSTNLNLLGYGIHPCGILHLYSMFLNCVCLRVRAESCVTVCITCVVSSCRRTPPCLKPFPYPY